MRPGAASIQEARDHDWDAKALVERILGSGVQLLVSFSRLEPKLKQVVQKYALLHKDLPHAIVSCGGAQWVLSDFCKAILPAEMDHLASGGFSWLFSFLCELCTTEGEPKFKHMNNLVDR
jgi:hypothetical protein